MKLIPINVTLTLQGIVLINRLTKSTDKDWMDNIYIMPSKISKNIAEWYHLGSDSTPQEETPLCMKDLDSLYNKWIGDEEFVPNINLFSYKMVVIPLNRDGVHWVLFVLFNPNNIDWRFNDQKITYMILDLYKADTVYEPWMNVFPFMH